MKDVELNSTHKKATENDQSLLYILKDTFFVMQEDL